MLNYRVQTCIDSATYEALEKYMEEKGHDTISVAVRKILRDYFGIDSSDKSNDEPCECILSETVKL